ncbi:tryptophan-rich antigen [Plasmodium malariae]|uniref:Tryptophan-rich antigen n=1 Tax=Plasmodium malariae TaxID=5858 RepID=A0A1A8WW94_PLAMA|nr:tryptophan-rich antigen [Plasmodium malariae]
MKYESTSSNNPVNVFNNVPQNTTLNNVENIPRSNNVIIQEEWNEWINELELDWRIFSTHMENEKNVWFGEREKQFKEFLKYVEDKWMNHNEDIEKEHNCNILKKSIAWDDDDWIKWINTDGKELCKKNGKIGLLKKTMWFTYNEQIMGEKENLMEWFRKKEDELVKNECRNWVNWEKKKNQLFNEWMNTFFNQWINMKQWNKWFDNSANLN